LRIRRVKLRNFRSHAETEVTFGDGVNAIIGQNGAGKTSLLEGIAYALFPELFRGGISDLTRRGSRSMEVELEFEQGGRTYLVWRRRDRSGPQARLMVREGSGWRLLQTSQRDVSAELTRALGTNPEAFVTAMYIRQGEILGFLSERPAKRMDTINRLLGGELFDRMERDLGEALGGFRSRLERLEGEISTLERQLSSADQVRRGLSEVLKELERVDGELREIRSRLDSLEGEESRLRSLRDEYLRLTESREQIERDLKACGDRISRIEARLEGLDRELSQLGELRSLAELEPILSEFDSLTKAYSALEAELAALEGEQRSLEEARRAAERLESVRRELEAVSRELEAVSRELALVDARGQRAEEISAQLTRVSANLEELDRRLEGLLRRLPPELGLSDLDSLCREGERLLFEARQAGQTVAELEKRAEYARGRVKFPRELLDALDGIPEVCPLCGSQLDASGSERVRQALREELEEGEAELRKAREELERIEGMMGALREFERLAEETSLPKAAAEREALIERVRRLEEELREIEAELRRRSDLVSRLAELQEMSSRLEGELAELRAAESLARRLSQGEADRLKRIESLRRQMEENRRKRDDLLGRLGKRIRDVSEALRQAREAREKLRGLESLIETRRELATLLRRERERERELGRRLSEVESSLVALGFDEARYSGLLLELDRLKGEFQETLARREKLSGKREELERRLGDLERLARELKELEAERTKLSGFIEALEEVRRSFGREGIQRALRESARPVLEHYTNELLSRFGIDFDGLELSEDYEVALIRGDERFTFRQLSGGEQVALALSLRLGLARAMAGTSLESILLDEPTVHLDSERRRELVSAIGELDIPQVIVVTHSGEFEEVADSLYNMERRKGVSRVTLPPSLGVGNS